MFYLKKEVLDEVKKIDALTYISDFEAYDLRKCGNSYMLKSHDSLKLSNGKWMWHSRGIGGKTALDFLIIVRGFYFIEAVQILIENIKFFLFLKFSYILRLFDAYQVRGIFLPS